MNRRMKWLAVTLAWLVASGAHAANDTSAMAPGDHTVDTGEVSLHYVVRGHGPVLFATSTGWGSTSRYLQKALAPLEAQMTMVYIDTRGSGGSSRPADSSHMSELVMADDLERLREALKLDRISVFGHSNGGSIALAYGERHPAHLDKLVLADPEVWGDHDWPAVNAFLKLWSTDPRYKDAVAVASKEDDGATLTDEEFERELTAEIPLYVSDPDRYAKPMEEELSDSHLSAWAMQHETAARKKDKVDLAKDAHNVVAKTLILSGTVDWICPYVTAQRLAARIPGSTLSTYANRGHMLWIEDPTRFYAEVKAFLAEPSTMHAAANRSSPLR